MPLTSDKDRSDELDNTYSEKQVSKIIVKIVSVVAIVFLLLCLIVYFSY